jgi:uncharacterized cupredoxin-like copper-binding protein
VTRALLPACLMLLALAGCGGDDPVEVSGRTVRLQLDEYRIMPREVEVAGPRVRLVVRDTGILTHNVKVFSTTEFDEEDKPIEVGGTPTAHPGETVSATLELKPGEYRMACSIANHDDLGAHAKLIVTGRR